MWVCSLVDGAIMTSITGEETHAPHIVSTCSNQITSLSWLKQINVPGENRDEHEKTLKKNKDFDDLILLLFHIFLFFVHDMANTLHLYVIV